MKAIFRHQSSKFQWFEWTMLLLSFGVIIEVIRFADVDFSNSGQPSGTGHHFKTYASTSFEKTEMMTPASWRQLAEDALLLEMTTKGPRQSERDWASLGIPTDELAFFEYWQNNLLDTTLLDVDGRLTQMLEARDLYQSVGNLMQQEMGQEDFFARMEHLYSIPIPHSRRHYFQHWPTTPGQWATFVAQNKIE